MQIPFYVGCYAPKGQDSLFECCLDTQTGAVSLTHACREVENPSYLALSKDGETLYAVSETQTFENESGGGFAALSCRNGLSLEGIAPTHGQDPCHIYLQEAKHRALVSNYTDGSLSVFETAPGMPPHFQAIIQHKGHGPNAERQEGPHVHFCGPVGTENLVGAADLGADAIVLYRIEQGVLTRDSAISLPCGTGVRHFISHPSRPELLYAACELTSEVLVLKFEGKTWQVIQRVSSLPHPVAGNTCAAIRQTADGRFLLVSNRGHNSIAVFSCTPQGLSPLRWIDAHGQDPRDFLLLKNLLLAANQTSRSLSIFKFNPQTAEAELCQTVSFPAAPVCVAAAKKNFT